MSSAAEILVVFLSVALAIFITLGIISYSSDSSNWRCYRKNAKYYIKYR